MSESDLLRFLDKVDQLQQLVRSLEAQPGRRESLAECSNHNQVVRLARSWGFEIGRRWGEPDRAGPRDGNVFEALRAEPGQETSLRLHGGSNWCLDLIRSNAYCTPEEDWFDQETHEWVMVLQGSATLEYQDSIEGVDLSVGDHLHLQPHRLHRVVRTDPDPGTLWLALHWLV